MTDSASSSQLSQFGLYRTIDKRTEEFLKLSKKKQLRQGCICAVLSTALTVFVVIVILLVYEYSFLPDSLPSDIRFNYLSDSVQSKIIKRNPTVDERPANDLLPMTDDVSKQELNDITDSYKSALSTTEGLSLYREASAMETMRASGRMPKSYPTQFKLLPANFPKKFREYSTKTQEFDNTRKLNYFNKMVLSKTLIPQEIEFGSENNATAKTETYEPVASIGKKKYTSSEKPKPFKKNETNISIESQIDKNDDCDKNCKCQKDTEPYITELISRFQYLGKKIKAMESLGCTYLKEKHKGKEKIPKQIDEDYTNQHKKINQEQPRSAKLRNYDENESTEHFDLEAHIVYEPKVPNIIKTGKTEILTNKLSRLIHPIIKQSEQQISTQQGYASSTEGIDDDQFTTTALYNLDEYLAVPDPGKTSYTFDEDSNEYYEPLNVNTMLNAIESQRKSIELSKNFTSRNKSRDDESSEEFLNYKKRDGNPDGKKYKITSDMNHSAKSYGDAIPTEQEQKDNYVNNKIATKDDDIFTRTTELKSNTYPALPAPSQYHFVPQAYAKYKSPLFAIKPKKHNTLLEQIIKNTKKDNKLRRNISFM